MVLTHLTPEGVLHYLAPVRWDPYGSDWKESRWFEAVKHKWAASHRWKKGHMRQDHRKKRQNPQSWWQSINSRKPIWIQVNLNKGENLTSPKNTSTRQQKTFFIVFEKVVDDLCFKKKLKKLPHMLPTCRIYFKGHSSAEKNQLSSVKKPRADVLQTFKNQFRIISLAVSHLAYIYDLVNLPITHNKWNVSFSLFKKSHIHTWFEPPRSRGISVTFTQRATIQKMFFMRP